MKSKNNQQDIEIAIIKTKVKDLEKRFEKFVTNEFAHLRSRVDWVLGTVIIGFLISIALIVLSKYL